MEMASLLWIGVNQPNLGTTSPPPGYYAYQGGEIVTVDAIPNGDNVFIGWYLDSEFHPENPITFTMPNTGIVTLVANFSPPIPKASLVTVTATDVKLNIQSKVYPEGETAICSPAASNLKIDITVQNSGAKDGTLYTRLKDADTGNTLYEANATVPAGQKQTFTATIDMPSDKPLKLTLEYGHLEDTTAVQDGTLNFTVYRAYTLTINVNDPSMGTTNPAPGTYAYQEGASATVTATPNSGYKFDHWTLNGETRTENPTTITMNRDYTLTANFVKPPSPPTHTLTVVIQPPDAGTVTLNPSDGTYPEGTTVTATATPASGYKFSQWLLNGETRTENPTTIIMDKDYTLTAIFTQLPTYKLTIAVNDPTMGTTNPAPGEYTYPEGASVTVQAIPNMGYTFVSWTLDGQTRTENPTTVTINRDYTLTANFQHAPVGVTIAGTVRGLLGRPVAGATVTLNGRTTITDPSGKYTFTDLTPAVYRITVEHWLYETQSKAITATEPKTYTVDFQLSLKTPYLTAGLSTLAIIAGFITYRTLYPKPKPPKGGKT
jgi:uncharacterized repeat protein (TIGR02543 family)